MPSYLCGPLWWLSSKESTCNEGATRDRVRSMGGEDPLEEGMATHSSILAWKTPCTEEPGRPQSRGSHRVRHDRVHTHAHTDTHSHQQSTRGPFPCYLYQRLLFLAFFTIIILIGVRCCLVMAVVHLSMVVNNAERPFLYPLAICMSSLEKCLFRSSAYF